MLWYLTPSFPPPPELRLKAPARAKPGVPYQVTVYSYADDGTRSAAAGATVTGAAAPTGAGGHTMVTSTEAGTDRLRATRGQDIPSNRVKVCVDPDLLAVPARARQADRREPARATRSGARAAGTRSRPVAAATGRPHAGAAGTASTAAAAATR